MLNRVNKRQRAVKKLNLKQIEAILRHLLTPNKVLKTYFDLRIGCLKLISRTEKVELNRCNHKLLMKIPNSRLICIRSFSSCMNKPDNIFIVRKELNQINKTSKRYFSKHSIMAVCKQPLLKKPTTKPFCYSMVFLPSYLPSLSCPKSITTHTHKKLPSLKIYNKCPSLKNSLELQRNKEILIYHGPSYLISLHRIHRRGFHITLFNSVNSKSDKPFACKKMEEICKSTEVKKDEQHDQSCEKKEKSDEKKETSHVCHQKKVKCNKRQQPKKDKAEAKSKPKIEQKIMDPECKKTCLARGKCEWPHTVPPTKMDYVKVTCPSSKFTKPTPCPSTSEHLQKDDGFPIETKKTNQKKQVYVPPPLPKPPFGPTALCPCPPPRKMHPGPCPCYKKKEVSTPPLIQPCPLKKKIPCPTDVHVCPWQKKPCNLKQSNTCEHRKRKKIPTI